MKKTMEWYENTYPDVKERMYAFHKYMDDTSSGKEIYDRALAQEMVDFTVEYTAHYFNIPKEYLNFLKKKR